MSRRGLALGLAIGMFFGLLIPVAQIPVSAAAAVLLRANLPAAVGSTLVSNPVTFGPLYYAAWRLGKLMLGEEVEDGDAPPQMATDASSGAAGEGALDAPEGQAPPSWWEQQHARLAGVGKPLVAGLVVMSCAVGILTYLTVSWGWWLRTRLRRRRRLRAAARTVVGHAGRG